MAGGRQESLGFASPNRSLSEGAERFGAQTTEQDGDDRIATFHFDGPVASSTSPSISSAQQKLFKADFHRELASLKTWAVEVDWLGDVPTALDVFVSADYEISKSLVPAWYGDRGHMEFPTSRVIARKAAIAHELVHVFFPNSNRFLAEGLAIYLQAEIGGNAAFPNFSRPLHELVRERMQEMMPEFSRGDPQSLDRLRLTELDEIATPSPLALRIGQDFYGEEPRGQARVYPIAGSFVQFMIETRGIERFRALYRLTPFVPLAQNAGGSDRWLGPYGLSLGDLESEWKSLIVGRGPATCDDEAAGGRRCTGTLDKSLQLNFNREYGDA